MSTQLQIYTINRGRLHQFADEWKAQVLPLRIKHGFKVHDAWTIEESNQFAWLISYDGDKSWESKEKAYYSSPEREAMNPNPARLIARTEQDFVKSIM